MSEPNAKPRGGVADETSALASPEPLWRVCCVVIVDGAFAMPEPRSNAFAISEFAERVVNVQAFGACSQGCSFGKTLAMP